MGETDVSDYSDCYFTNPDGLKQHYRDYNTAGPDAPVVLCMPGLTRNPKDFEAIADHISDRCRVIAIANRGRGLSDYDPNPQRYSPLTYVADVMVLLQQLDIKQVIALGTSLGGLMTILIQAMHPGTLKGAIINDIGPEVDPKGIARIKSYVGKGNPPQSWQEAINAVKAANAGVYPNFTRMPTISRPRTCGPRLLPCTASLLLCCGVNCRIFYRPQHSSAWLRNTRTLCPSPFPVWVMCR